MRFNKPTADLMRRLYGKQVARAMGVRDEPPTPDPRLKGVRYGNCNRTACQRPGANGWHTGTHAWYCPDCTYEINRVNRVDALRLYGIPVLIVVPDTITPEEREAWRINHITIPEAKRGR